MMGDLPVWKQVLIALLVVAAMGVGTAYAGMCGGILFALATGVFIQVVLFSLRHLSENDESES